MPGVTVSRRAIADLAAADAYLDALNPDAAARLRGRLQDGIDSLVALPGRGRPGRRAGTRELILRPYIVVYRAPADGVEIARVRHQAENR